MSYPFSSYSHVTRTKGDRSGLFTHSDVGKPTIAPRKSRLCDLKGATHAKNNMPEVQERDFIRDNNMHVLRIQLQTMATRSILS